MRILVTGGAGFIGSHVSEAYVRDGHEVLVLDDLSTGREENVPNGACLEVVDLREHGRVRALLESFRPHLINHHAAQIDIRRSVADPLTDLGINVVATVHLLQSAVEIGVDGILFASSGGAIYGETPHPVVEEAPKAPISPYGAAKAAVEGYLFSYTTTFGLKSFSLRYGNVYGPRQDPTGEAGVVAIFSRAMLAGGRPTIFGDGKQVRDYIFVLDAAHANLLATERLLCETVLPQTPDTIAYNIGTGNSTSVEELFSELKGVTGFEETAVYAESRVGELLESRLNVTKAGRELRFVAGVPFAEGLARTVEWIRTH